MAYSALEVAKYVIFYEHSKGREISNLRLQKLLYFIQAKFYSTTGKPCFSDEMEAWEFGPVVASVYHAFKIFGSFDINITPVIINIDTESKLLINNILDSCADYPTYQLVEISHKQAPWLQARNNYFNKIISSDSMRLFFFKP